MKDPRRIVIPKEPHIICPSTGKVREYCSAMIPLMVAGDTDILHCLQAQNERIRVINGYYNDGVFHAEYVLEDARRIENEDSQNIIMENAVARNEDSSVVVGFRLVIADGFISQLDAFLVRGDEWPTTPLIPERIL